MGDSTHPDGSTGGIAEFVARLAEANGDPGGGSAAGIMTAMAAALGEMVCRYTADDPVADAAGAALASARAAALAAAEADGHASAMLGEALGEGEGGGARDRRIVTAALTATETSAQLGRVALDVWEQLQVVARVGDPNVAADTAVAADAIAAGLGGALTNLTADLRLIGAHADPADEVDSSFGEVGAQLSDARRAARALAERLGER